MELSNDRLSLTLDPAFGARITSLTDRTSGRQWLVPGPCIGDASDSATYLGTEARGWDECFPTVSPCNSPDWGRPLRDHGDLWGRPWACTAIPDGIAAEYRTPSYLFRRTLRLGGPVLTAGYSVTNLGNVPFPYLFAQHCLLATTQADRLHLAGFGPFRISGGTDGGTPILPQTHDWPNLGPRDLRDIAPGTAGFALKSYAPAMAQPSASVHGPTCGIRFDWDATDLPHLGLWLDYGGWPPGAPVHQIALEPTTGSADDLADALSRGHARWLPAQAAHSWTVRITLTAAPG